MDIIEQYATALIIAISSINRHPGRVNLNLYVLDVVLPSGVQRLAEHLYRIAAS